MNSHIAVLATAVTVILASCVSSPNAVPTPYGAFITDYDQESDQRVIHVTGQVSRHFSPDADNSIRGFGFANGYDGEQTLVSNLHLSDGLRTFSLPSTATADLWNLDLDSGRSSKVRKIEGLDGYSLHGSDGERGYSAVFFFTGDRYVGRVVSTLFQDIWFSPSGERLVLTERDYAT